MKPYLHGLVSVKRWGGKPEDYQKVHDFLDSSKAHFPDMRHRAILHSSFGIYLTETVFGTNLTTSDGRLVSVRDVAEQHVIDDLGRIPTVQDYLSGMPFYDWLGGKKRAPTRTVDMTAPATMTLAELRQLKTATVLDATAVLSNVPPLSKEQEEKLKEALKPLQPHTRQRRNTRSDDGHGIAASLAMAANALPAVARILEETEERGSLLTALAFDHKRDMYWPGRKTTAPDEEPDPPGWMECIHGVCIHCDAERAYDKANAKKKQYDDAVKANARPLVQELLTNFFKANPDVGLVSWTQYTPYFNDGEACTFNVHEPYIAFKKDLEGLTAEQVSDLAEEEEFISRWAVRETNPALAAALQELEQQMSVMDDLLLQAFGDHQQVRAFADGRVEATEYSHD